MKSHFCSRKGGATIKGKFYPVQRTSEILGADLRRQAARLAYRNDRKQARLDRGIY